MSKKYEIVNVGGVNRVRALRSWMVQGRQVNMGDVGGAVFDERTLSQDGDAWIFSGRLDNPLIRVGGDSVVNIGETAPSILPRVNITGTSSLDANFNVNFITSVINNATPLTPAMMEQGGYSGAIGSKITKTTTSQVIRKTAKMFTGGVAFNLPAPETGYQIQAFAVDENDIVVYQTAFLTTPIGIPAGDHTYVYFNVAKTPAASTVPADVTAAGLTFPNKADSTINIVDSHITLTGQNAGYVLIDPSTSNGDNTTNIVGSTVNVTRTTGTPKLILICDLINTTASINMLTFNVTMMGVYKNVKNLVWSGIAWSALQEFREIVQATDCDNFVMDGVNINTAAIDGANAISTPYKFIRCNMNTARIVNQPKINNTYEDINFDLATADLGVSLGTYTLVSSNVNGMYRGCRVASQEIGYLVESGDSVKYLDPVAMGANYNTTIYADAWMKGTINLRGTNVFGNAVKKPKTRTIDVVNVAVQGSFNTVTVGQTITGVNSATTTQSVIPLPVNLRTAKGLTVSGLTGNLQAAFYCTDAKNVITNVIGWGGNRDLTGVTGVEQPQCFIAFRSSAGTGVTPADLAGVTIETYNGCKIVNTKTGIMTIAGNVRVEDNAVLKDVGLSGSGYFGGESVTEAPTALAAPSPVEGYAFMKDKAVFSPTSITSSSSITRLHMQDNARMTGAVASSNLNLFMKDNADYAGQLYSMCNIRIEDNVSVSGILGVTAASYGKLTMKDKASLGANITVKGDITLCGNYRNTAGKTYSGKQVYDTQDAPIYDNNVKTKYDF